MNKMLSSLYFLVGFFLIGVGSYIVFENYNISLSSSKNQLYTGVYKSSDNTIVVSNKSKNVLFLSINNESYDFEFNGKAFENIKMGMVVEFKDDFLVLLKDGRELDKYKKNK